MWTRFASRSLFLASLRAYFEAFGVVRDIEIKIDSATGMSRGFGFVLFETEDSVNAVCQTREHFLGKFCTIENISLFFFIFVRCFVRKSK